jgi:hypothetical protein
MACCFVQANSHQEFAFFSGITIKTKSSEEERETLVDFDEEPSTERS